VQQFPDVAPSHAAPIIKIGTLQKKQSLTGLSGSLTCKKCKCVEYRTAQHELIDSNGEMQPHASHM
jgi:hypothetical protein